MLGHVERGEEMVRENMPPLSILLNMMHGSESDRLLWIPFSIG